MHTSTSSIVRTITAVPPVSPERLHGGNPILEPVAGHAWESRVVLNPAAVRVNIQPKTWSLTEAESRRLGEGACVMVYRAQGDRVDGHAPSSLGLALFTQELELVRRFEEPVVRPDAPYHNLGAEDPRCTRVGDLVYMYYTGHYRVDGGEPDVTICLATTRDFVTWEQHGPAAGDVNDVRNKNAALLPEPVDGKWILLHRPMVGPDAMTVHWAEADDPAGPWRSRGMLMASYVYREFERSWIGAGGPPISLGENRFLMIYHQGHFTPEGTREYDLAAALLDFSREDPVVARIEPLMRPFGAAERTGDPELGVDNVLFTCANYRLDDRLIIPYAGADSRIFGASIGVDALVQALENGDDASLR